MWNVKAYKKALNEIKENGMFNGKKVETLEEIYDELTNVVYRGRDAIKGWGRPSSNGPGEESIRLELERVLNVPEGAFLISDTDRKKVESVRGLSELNKIAIFKCYTLMKDYLHDEAMEQEECFAQMYTMIEMQRVAIPDGVYEKIIIFIDKVLAPIIYERENTFAECYSEKIGFTNADGNWEVHNEDCAKKMCMAFIMKTMEIEEKLDKFAMDELHQYLV